MSPPAVNDGLYFCSAITRLITADCLPQSRVPVYTEVSSRDRMQPDGFSRLASSFPVVPINQKLGKRILHSPHKSREFRVSQVVNWQSAYKVCLVPARRIHPANVTATLICVTACHSPPVEPVTQLFSESRKAIKAIWIRCSGARLFGQTLRPDSSTSFFVIRSFMSR